jgi:hypothetical protein
MSVTDELKVIPAEAFQHCYEQRKQLLRHCVAVQGNYFEGDNLDLKRIKFMFKENQSHYFSATPRMASLLMKQN